MYPQWVAQKEKQKKSAPGHPIPSLVFHHANTHANTQKIKVLKVFKVILFTAGKIKNNPKDHQLMDTVEDYLTIKRKGVL